jgi:uracil-DNA glycosylase
VPRCEFCPNKYNCVPPSGPIDAELLFIGEAPGKVENEKLIPFVGQTGQEVDRHYLPLAGLHRGRVRMANAICCLPDRPRHQLALDRQSDIDLLYSCASCNLYTELSRPHRLIIPMGAFACYAVNPDINLELQHGIPVETAYGTAFPLYHPAIGLHEPKRMLMLRNDFIRLGKYLKNKLFIPKDEYTPEYAECNDYTFDQDSSGCLACDTEVTRHREPWCLTWSTNPGQAWFISAQNKSMLEAFQYMLNRWQGPILFHNWLFDSQVVADMGLKFPQKQIVDTMQLAFILGSVPQGLKALCFRLLAMHMESFDDVVTPHSTPICLSYMREIVNHDWPKPNEELVRDADTGLWKLYKPQGMGSKAKRFLTDYAKKPHMDIFERWKNWEDSHKMIEDQMGPWPGKSIEHVPFEKALYYSCRDSDGLLRLWTILQAMIRDVRRKSQSDWGINARQGCD